MEFVNRHWFKRIFKDVFKKMYTSLSIMFEILGQSLASTPIGIIFDAEMWGSWDYYYKRVPIYNEYTEKYDKDVGITFRISNNTNRHQYWNFNRSNIWGFRGWEDVPAEGIKLRINKN